MDTNTINHVSLCSGYGGIDLGLKRAIGERLRTVAFVEVECFAVCNLAAKAEAKLLDNAPIWSDLRTFPWGKFHGLVDILSGGYPCQPFSAAGKRLGAEDPRHLWPYISAGIAAMRPSVCFFENVEGHISLGLPDVLQDLAGMGYRTTWCVASASECGAPHQRKRVFILAHDTSLGIQGRWPSWIEESRPHAGQALPLRGGDAGCGHEWPSRPGEQQFAWEPPRVVGNAAQCDGVDASRIWGALERKSRRRKSCDTSVEAAAGALGHANSPRPQERPRQRGAAIQGADADGGENAGGEIKPELGLLLDGSADGLGGPNVSGLSDQELAEIRQWMATSTNRTDSLRLLGNGVVPATAERAFRVLVGELMEAIT